MQEVIRKAFNFLIFDGTIHFSNCECKHFWSFRRKMLYVNLSLIKLIHQSKPGESVKKKKNLFVYPLFF